MSEIVSTTPSDRRAARRRLPSPGCLLAVTVLVCVTLMAAGFVWRALRQAERLDLVDRLGGQVELEPVISDEIYELLHETLGWQLASGLTEIIYVDLSDTAATDADLELLHGAKRLRGLSLNNTQITDDTLRRLRGLTELEEVELWGTAVTDAGLTHLTGLHQLNHLNLGNTRVTDAGLQHLRGLVNLKYLILTGTGISDTGLTHLDGLPQLEYLNVGNTDVTPVGAREFRKRHGCDVDRRW